MRLRDLTLCATLDVVSRMRPQDRRCVAALAGNYSDESFAVNRWSTPGPAWSLDDDEGRPQVIAGIQFINEWTGVMWLIVADGFALNSWRKVLSTTRKVMQSALDPANAFHRHRLEASVLADWPEAQLLVKRLGFELEGTKRAAGSGGEGIQVWAMTRRSEK